MCTNSALPPSPPTIAVTLRYPPNDACGEARVLKCMANALQNLFAPPTILWIDPDDNEVSVDESSNPIFIPETGELVFGNITTNNTGAYTCRSIINITEAEIFNHEDKATILINADG